VKKSLLEIHVAPMNLPGPINPHAAESQNRLSELKMIDEFFQS